MYAHSAATLYAVTPESPEVRALIVKGLKFLEENGDQRLGGKCLVALAFLKEGYTHDHPRIKEALAACRGELRAADDPRAIYGPALAVIFLVEADAVEHRELIAKYVDRINTLQKPHGGFGYSNAPTGDTSQTQYAALCFWEMARAGVAPPAADVQKCAEWLMRTQDPSGVWGYQGDDPGSYELVEQKETGVSMLAAALGSVMICADLFGITQAAVPAESNEQSAATSALRRADEPEQREAVKISRGGVNVSQLAETIALGQAWMDANFSVKAPKYEFYYLYSVERFRSFEELYTGEAPGEPDWYNKGFAFLKETQRSSGGWSSESRPACATAFAVLFLQRSTQKSIQQGLGAGTLVGGRGLSANLANMHRRGNRLEVVAPSKTPVDKLLALLENSESESLEALLNSPAALSVANVGADEARRLQQVVKSGPPHARVLAVRALARIRNLDYVPALLYAMTDPDNRVVREARDGLRFVSRKFEGYGLPDNFTDRQRYDALEQWKQWYARIRPDAPPIN